MCYDHFFGSCYKHDGIIYGCINEHKVLFMTMFTKIHLVIRNFLSEKIIEHTEGPDRSKI